LDEARARGGTPKKTCDYRHASVAGFAVEWSDGNGAGLLNPVPRCRRRDGMAKSPASQGFKAEIFPCGKILPAP